MNCRYCGGVYAATDRTCGGCGSPKTMKETLLDVPEAPGHWSHSMMGTVQRVLLISGCLFVGTVLLGMVGLGTLGSIISFFWVMPCAGIALLLGAWKSSEDEPAERIRNFVLSGVLWCGLIVSMLLSIGIAIGA